MSKFKLRRSIGVPADVAGAELARISAAHGGLTAEILVAEAEPHDSPMHPAFTWDDIEAGTRWRLQEARNIIRSVHLVEDGEDQGCAYAHVTVADDDETGRYLPVAEVVTDAGLLSSAIAGLARKQQEAAKALADLEGQARRRKNRKQASGLGRARKATETAARELGALT